MSEDVVRLVVAEEPEPRRFGLFDLFRRRFDGSYVLDQWGLDDDATRLAGRLAAVRWSTSVTGIEHLPTRGPALLVANRRLGWSEPVVVASALLDKTGRIVRPVGGMDIDPIGGFLRRLGALPARAEEVAAALRAGNLVLMPTRREPVRNRPGHLPIELLASAVTVGVPLIPVAVIGSEFRRHWTVRIGTPVQLIGPDDGRVDARADARIVGTAAVEVSAALDELLADVHERDLGRRILSLVPGSGRHDDAGQWKGS